MDKIDLDNIDLTDFIMPIKLNYDREYYFELKGRLNSYKEYLLIKVTSVYLIFCIITFLYLNFKQSKKNIFACILRAGFLFQTTIKLTKLLE